MVSSPSDAHRVLAVPATIRRIDELKNETVDAAIECPSYLEKKPRKGLSIRPPSGLKTVLSSPDITVSDQYSSWESVSVTDASSDTEQTSEDDFDSDYIVVSDSEAESDDHMLDEQTSVGQMSEDETTDRVVSDSLRSDEFMTDELSSDELESDELMSDYSGDSEFGVTPPVEGERSYYFVKSRAFGAENGRKGNPNLIINTVVSDEEVQSELNASPSIDSDGE
ncbi:hypothetical protein MD484_g8678, partial [Candolleomyces efflorescens]